MSAIIVFIRAVQVGDFPRKFLVFGKNQVWVKKFAGRPSKKIRAVFEDPRNSLGVPGKQVRDYRNHPKTQELQLTSLELVLWFRSI